MYEPLVQWQNALYTCSTSDALQIRWYTAEWYLVSTHTTNYTHVYVLLTLRRCCTKSVLNLMRCEGRLPSSTHRGTVAWTTCQVICSSITQICTPAGEGLICIYEYANFSEVFLWCHFLFTSLDIIRVILYLEPTSVEWPEILHNGFQSFFHKPTYSAWPNFYGSSAFGRLSYCFQPFSNTQSKCTHSGVLLLGEICLYLACYVSTYYRMVSYPSLPHMNDDLWDKSVAFSVCNQQQYCHKLL